MTKIKPIRLLILAAAVLVAPALVATNASNAAETKAQPVIVYTDAEKKAAKDFDARVADYVALNKKLEATLPALPEKATPEQIDKHRQSLNALTKNARKNAKQGEFFTPGMVALVKRALAATLSGPDGKSTQKSIMDDNPGSLKVAVNDPYPAEAPVSSMPVEFLETVPKLPEGLEYRFLGKRLVLVCCNAQMVLDLTPNVLP